MCCFVSCAFCRMSPGCTACSFPRGISTHISVIFPPLMFSRWLPGCLCSASFFVSSDCIVLYAQPVSTSTVSARGHSPLFWRYTVTATTAVPLNLPAQCANTGNKDADLLRCRGDWPNNYSFMSMHPGGGNFGLADGSVRFVPETVDLVVYRSYGSMMDGKPATLD